MAALPAGFPSVLSDAAPGTEGPDVALPLDRAGLLPHDGCRKGAQSNLRRRWRPAYADGWYSEIEQSEQRAEGGATMPDLPKRTLGRTGMDVTVLGYGAMELRGAPRGRDVSDEQASRILNAVLDSGINFIDTSIDYGVAEERIGKFI